MELSDLSTKERNIIEALRENPKLGSLIKGYTENYYHKAEGENAVTEYLESMFQSMDEFSEANLKDDS